MKIKTASRRGQPAVSSNRCSNPLPEEIPLTLKAGSFPFRLKNILVPIDFSELSKKALRYALRFAEQFGARIILLHVVGPRVGPEDHMIGPPKLEGRGVRRMNEREAQLANLWDRATGLRRVETIVHMGKPYREIINLAKARKVDLIIIARHGYTGPQRLVLGSTAERVVRHAPCPVLVVRETENEFI